eukprot:Gb_22181 [translate_table: standard]
MAAKPKKGKGGKRKKGPKEPKHDSGWEKTIKYGKWERPIEALPDPNAFPKFGELREKLLSACEQLPSLQMSSVFGTMGHTCLPGSNGLVPQATAYSNGGGFYATNRYKLVLREYGRVKAEIKEPFEQNPVGRLMNNITSEQDALGSLSLSNKPIVF